MYRQEIIKILDRGANDKVSSMLIKEAKQRFDGMEYDCSVPYLIRSFFLARGFDTFPEIKDNKDIFIPFLSRAEEYEHRMETYKELCRGNSKKLYCALHYNLPEISQTDYEIKYETYQRQGFYFSRNKIEEYFSDFKTEEFRNKDDICFPQCTQNLEADKSIIKYFSISSVPKGDCGFLISGKVYPESCIGNGISFTFAANSLKLSFDF